MSVIIVSGSLNIPSFLVHWTGLWDLWSG